MMRRCAHGGGGGCNVQMHVTQATSAELEHMVMAATAVTSHWQGSQQQASKEDRPGRGARPPPSAQDSALFFTGLHVGRVSRGPGGL